MFGVCDLDVHIGSSMRPHVWLLTLWTIAGLLSECRDSAIRLKVNLLLSAQCLEAATHVEMNANVFHEGTLLA